MMVANASATLELLGVLTLQTPTFPPVPMGILPA